MNPETPLCPLCHNKLYSKKYGMVCKNIKCRLFWKLGGWCLQNSLWMHQDNGYDRNARWDRKHNYPPRKFEIAERDFAAMLLALEKDGSLCFVVPGKYFLRDNEVAPE